MKTRKLKILDLYAGIGGNRKLWGNAYEITAIEIDPKIAKIYQDFFSNDRVIVADAHRYLLEHYKEFDFIWASPPCPSHSVVRKNSAVARGQSKPIYPEMSLYQEIIFLQHHFKGKWLVENVIAYYDPLIKPQELERHWWWANFLITPFHTGKTREHDGTIDRLESRKGFNLKAYGGINKKKTLRNCVEPEIGLHILECALGKNKQKILL